VTLPEFPRPQHPVHTWYLAMRVVSDVRTSHLSPAIYFSYSLSQMCRTLQTGMNEISFRDADSLQLCELRVRLVLHTRRKSILCTLKVAVTVSQYVRKLLVTLLSFQTPFESKMRWSTCFPSIQRLEVHSPVALPNGKSPDTHCLGGWVSPKTGVDGCGKSRPHRD